MSGFSLESSRMDQDDRPGGVFVTHGTGYDDPGYETAYERRCRTATPLGAVVITVAR